MAVAAAEIPQWSRVDQAFAEQYRQATYEQQIFLGGLAVNACVETSEQINDSTMLSVVQGAKLGDPAKLRMMKTNIGTDIAERMFKIGLSEVALEFRQGRLLQEKQPLRDISANSLRYSVANPEMTRRFLYDNQHVFVVEALQPTGILDTHDAIVYSTTPTNMSAKEKADYGLYVDTESCAIQRFSLSGEKAVLETAFVAGKPTPTSERQDIAIIRQLAEQSGVILPTNDGTDMLQYMVLVPKSDIPNGLIDIIKRYDAISGTFFGEAKPRRDYDAYAVECKTRTKVFAGVIEQIMNQMLAEAHLYKTPLEVVMRLDELSEHFCVKFAANHREVNTAVFGKTSALHLEEYRFFMDRGDTTRADESLIKAQATAKSGSCPLFKSGSSESDTNSGTNVQESKGKKMMNCPFCKARVYDDPCAKILSCWDCKAHVVNGKVKSEGDGGSKARVKRLLAERQEIEAQSASQYNPAAYTRSK